MPSPKPPRPDLEFGYHGPAAAGFADGGIPDSGDVLDLFETDLWRPYKNSEAAVLRGPAICALASCTGATLSEMLRMRCGRVRTGEAPPMHCSVFMPLGHSAVKLGGNGMQVRARTVPLLKLAQDILARYDAVAPRAKGCDAFFTDDTGKAADRGGVREQFRGMGNRIGINGATLPGRLRGWFLGWLEDAEEDEEDETALHHIAGWAIRDLQDDHAGPPNLASIRAILEDHHPFGRPTREMLRWQGAVARAFPSPHFPALSRELQSALELHRADGKRFHPAELHEAVARARASGKRTQEIAAHYGIPLRWTRYHTGASRNLSTRELKALRAYAKATKRPTARGLQAALASAGRTITVKRGHYWARRYGVSLFAEPRRPPAQPDAVRAYIDSTEKPTARGLQAVLAAAGHTMSLELARGWAKTRGIKLVDERTIRTELLVTAVRAYAAATAWPTARGVQTALAQAGHSLSLMSAWRWAKEHGIALADERQLVLSDAESDAVRAYKAATERTTAIGLQEALARAGRDLSPWQVRSVAQRFGVALVHKKRELFTDAEIRALRDYTTSTEVATARGVRAVFAAGGRKTTVVQARYFAYKLGLVLADPFLNRRSLPPYANAPFRSRPDAAAHGGQAP